MPVFIFQMYGIVQSATFNVSSDNVGAALFIHARAQIERLGLMLSNVSGSNFECYTKNEFRGYFRLATVITWTQT